MLSLTVQDCMDIQYYILAVLFVNIFNICCLLLCAIGVLNGLNNIYQVSLGSMTPLDYT